MPCPKVQVRAQLRAWLMPRIVCGAGDVVEAREVTVEEKMGAGYYRMIAHHTLTKSARRRGGNRRKSDSQVGIHPVLPAPPSVFVRGVFVRGSLR